MSIDLFNLYDLPVDREYIPRGTGDIIIEDKVIEGKVTLARPFTDIKPFESVTPFVQVSYIDNNFDTTTFNFATTDFDGDVTVVAGVNVAFWFYFS